MAKPSDFLNIMNALEPLMASDYTEHQEDILDLTERVTQYDIGLRYFMHQSLQEETHRTLSGAQSFFIYASPSFTVRLNLWFPKDDRVRPENEEALKEHFSYEMCHNHNYDFFTIGLLGPGYKTDFLETSQNLDNAKIGDPIQVDRHWSTVLGKNDTLFVPKNTHFHTQYEPEAFSITMNFIPNRTLTSNQYILNANRDRIETIISP